MVPLELYQTTETPLLPRGGLCIPGMPLVGLTGLSLPAPSAPQSGVNKAKSCYILTSLKLCDFQP